MPDHSSDARLDLARDSPRHAATSRPGPTASARRCATRAGRRATSARSAPTPTMTPGRSRRCSARAMPAGVAGDAKKGRALFLSRAKGPCTGCHLVPGDDVWPAGSVGPGPLDDRRPQAARRVPLSAALRSARAFPQHVDAAVGRAGRASRPRRSSTWWPICRRCKGRCRPRRIRTATRSRAEAGRLRRQPGSHEQPRRAAAPRARRR